MSEQDRQQLAEKIWKRCGFTEYNGVVFTPDGEIYGYGYPYLTLDNLFKWAVPKLREVQITKHPNSDSYYVLLRGQEGHHTQGIHKDPSLALTLAIGKVIDAEQKGSSHE